MPDALPVATYRLQLNKDFTFHDAAAIVPDIAALNISHLYLSPVFQSVPGSMHGYDVEDFSRLSEERGGEEGFARLHQAAKDAGLKIILDIVPNHMGIAGENPYWFDVLAKGRASPYWKLFDMRVPEGGKLHLPVLAADMAGMVEAGAIKGERHKKFGMGFSVSGRFFPAREEDSAALETWLDNPVAADLLNILENQHYKFVIWTESTEVINYRRFFDIMDLAAVRVEDEEIFNLSHEYLFQLACKYEAIDGVRVDHVDGLSDPGDYVRKLSQHFNNIWVEKILGPSEQLPESWPVKGTTGYEFIDLMNQVFVDPSGLKILETYWQHKLEPKWESFHACVLESKSEALRTLFSSELKRIVQMTATTTDEGEQAELFWSALTICLPVYRTYAGSEDLSEDDKEFIEAALEEAGSVFGPAFAASRDRFLQRLLSPASDKDAQAVREWQQLSGPSMAKGLEDTAHYRYTPLAALNEVGCEPRHNALTGDEVIRKLDKETRLHPGRLVASSTHDTKRSEDARCRLYALSEEPEQWLSFFESAVKLNQPLKRGFDLRPATEYFLYQALVASWPLDHGVTDEYADRVVVYMQKSCRENRTETSWLKQSGEYEGQVEKFVRAILRHDPFLKLMADCMPSIESKGALNSLAALTLKIFSGAVPDFYQGMEVWNFSLVDPDNRRKVDYKAIRTLSESVKKDEAQISRVEFLKQLVKNWKTGAIKLWLTRTLLHIRQDNIDTDMRLRPVEITGKQSAGILAYQIGPLTVVTCRLGADEETVQINLPPGTYLNLLDETTHDTGGRLSAADLLAHFPVAVLKKV